MFEEWAVLYDSVYAAKGKDYESEARYLLRAMERIESLGPWLLASAARPDPHTAFHWTAPDHAADLGSASGPRRFDPSPAVRDDERSAFTAGARPTLLDVACGTGEHLRHLRSRFEVLGVDRCPEMLAVAQRKLPGTSLFLGDMTTFDLGRQCDVVTCLFSSVGYLPSNGALNRAVGRMAAHLRPGGLLLLEPPVSAVAVQPPRSSTLRFAHEGRLWERETAARLEGVRLHIRFRYRPLGEARSEIEQRTGTRGFVPPLPSRPGAPPCEIVEEQPIRLFTDRELREAFSRAGLEVEHDPVGPTGLGLYLARR